MVGGGVSGADVVGHALPLFESRDAYGIAFGLITIGRTVWNSPTVLVEATIAFERIVHVVDLPPSDGPTSMLPWRVSFSWHWSLRTTPGTNWSPAAVSSSSIACCSARSRRWAARHEEEVGHQRRKQQHVCETNLGMFISRIARSRITSSKSGSARLRAPAALRTI